MSCVCVISKNHFDIWAIKSGLYEMINNKSNVEWHSMLWHKLRIAYKNRTNEEVLFSFSFELRRKENTFRGKSSANPIQRVWEKELQDVDILPIHDCLHFFHSIIEREACAKDKKIEEKAYACHWWWCFISRIEIKDKTSAYLDEKKMYADVCWLTVRCLN